MSSRMTNWMHFTRKPSLSTSTHRRRNHLQNFCARPTKSTRSKHYIGCWVKERDEKSGKQASMHPLWEEYTWPTKDAEDKLLPQVEGQDKFYVNLYSGEVSLEFPVQEQNCLGGILADEMGSW